jgi:O-6-methylguanine DNA methyltransferase
VKNHFVELPVSTPDGQFTARYTENGLAELNFPKNGRTKLPLGLAAQQRSPTKIKNPKSTIRNPQLKNWHRATESALKSILAGLKPRQFPPLDVSAGTEFQQAVWRELRKISPGKTKSYGEIAERMGRHKAVRAVGGACGANPIPVLIPCHRVLAANKKLGGFSGGLHWKRRLLAREGIRLQQQNESRK